MKLGSLAAAVQSYIGNVAAGSIFAAFQSAGAGGAALGIMNGAIQGAGAAIFSSAAYAKYYLFSNTTAANVLWIPAYKTAIPHTLIHHTIHHLRQVVV